MSEMLDGLADDAYVTCWTIQNGAVWRQLQRRGRFWVPRHRVEPINRQAYDWLVEQQRQRIPGATGRYPIWAFARIKRSDLAINCRWAARSFPSSMLLTCRLPRSQVLLSEYDTWHVVLNNGYLDANDDPDAMDQWWAEAERRYGTAAHHSPYPPSLQAELEASWPRVFDVDHWREFYNPYVQATFEVLTLEQVVRAVPLRRPGRDTNRRIGALVHWL